MTTEISVMYGSEKVNHSQPPLIYQWAYVLAVGPA